MKNRDEGLWKRQIENFRGSESQADTFIEQCFEEKCIGITQGNLILNEWRTHKYEYQSYLQIISLDFQHYSRHDATHSVNILNSIELLLGKQRIMLLSASDLWLMLESAYFHDIGMASTYDEIKEMWESQEFRIYLGEVLAGNDIDLEIAANYYVQMDNLLHRREQMERLASEDEIRFLDGWPVEFERKIMILTADYVRRNHAQRSENFMKKMLEKTRNYGKNIILKERMGQLVAKVSGLHGRDYQDIENILPYHALGFDNRHMHPQFIAVMLRIGDLLDMDNNRFSFYELEHFGELPATSGYHYKKHEAIYHFAIDHRQIEASAMSDDYEVCKVISEWFQYLKENVEDLICDWNQFAPPELEGCTLQRCKLKVFHGDTEFDAKWQKSFEVDKKQLLSLMIGSSIYDSQLDCLREYIQNALDASKMQLWLDIKNGKIRLPRDAKEKEVTPLDIGLADYDAMALEIYVSVDLEQQQICFKIIDYGIGMETECIDSLSVVGCGWKGRKIYQNEIFQMPQWLKPSGGFGIGVQSAFMLTDCVHIITKSVQESVGYDIRLYSVKKGGSIVKIPKSVYRSGTEIEFKVPLDKFYKLIGDVKEVTLGDIHRERRHQELEIRFSSNCKDYFSKWENEKYVCSFLKYYINKTIPNSIFPIKIISKAEGEFEYRSPFIPNEEGFCGLKKGFLLEERYMCAVDDKLTVRIWDKKEDTFVCVYSWDKYIEDFDWSKAKELNRFCYKNVRVGNINGLEERIGFYNFIAVCIDFMGKELKEVLSLRRNAFSSDFNIGVYYQKYVEVYIKAIYHDLTHDKKEWSAAKINEHLQVYLFLLMAIPLLDKENLLKVMKFFNSRILTPEYIVTRRVENGKLEKYQLKTVDALETLCGIFRKGLKDSGNKEMDRVFVLSKENRISDDPSFLLKKMLEGSFEEILDDIGIGGDFVKNLQEGEHIYYDPDICHALLRLGRRFRMQYFRIRDNEENYLYAMINGLSEDWKYENHKDMSEEEFLKKAFFLEDRRNIEKNVNCKKYNDLRVEKIPMKFGDPGDEQRKNTFLISPIGYSLFMEILRQVDISISDISGGKLEKDKKIKMNHLLEKEEFLELVTNRDKFRTEYQLLVSWVYKYQFAVPDRKLKKDEIDKKYNDMIRDLYDTVFEKE